MPYMLSSEGPMETSILILAMPAHTLSQIIKAGPSGQEVYTLEDLPTIPPIKAKW